MTAGVGKLRGADLPREDKHKILGANMAALMKLRR